MSEMENVLVLKVRGVPENTEHRLDEHGLSSELFDGIDELCSELDVPFRAVSQSVQKEEFVEIPSRDADAVEPEPGWDGGAVQHTGGGIFCRSFHHHDLHLEVTYNADDPSLGVSLYAKQYDEDLAMWCNFGDEIDHRTTVETEREALNACARFMQNVNDGQYDEDIEEITGVEVSS